MNDKRRKGFYRRESSSFWSECTIIVLSDEENIASILVGDGVVDQMTIQLPSNRVIPIPAEALPEETYIRDSEGVIWKTTRIVCFSGDLRYHMETSHSKKRFKPYQYVSLDKIHSSETEFEVLEKSPFPSEEEIEDMVDEVMPDISEFDREIQRLQEEKREMIRERLHPIQQVCEHRWEKGEEEEGSSGMIGTSISREDECVICGLRKSVSYTRL